MKKLNEYILEKYKLSKDTKALDKNLKDNEIEVELQNLLDWYWGNEINSVYANIEEVWEWVCDCTEDDTITAKKFFKDIKGFNKYINDNFKELVIVKHDNSPGGYYITFNLPNTELIISDGCADSFEEMKKNFKKLDNERNK